MRLDVHKNGVKLFFITFAVAGREKVLSRLVEAKSRPELLPLGEVVKAGILALHQVWSAVGTSDYVIMPDHVHFLMVVDFLRAPQFNPLWATHRLLDAIEAGWHHRGQAPVPLAPLDMVAELKVAVARGREVAAAIERGEAQSGRRATQAGYRVAQAGCGATQAGYRVAQAWCSAAQSGCGAAAIAQAGCGAATIAHVGRGAAQAVCGAAQAGCGAIQAGCGAAGPGVPVLFERHPWLDLAFDPRQLKAIRHYIRLNPARALWKAAHPDLFVCHRAIRAARLLPLAPRRFDGIGNLPFLGSPFLFHVRLTLKKTVAEHEAAICEIVDKARRGWVPVSDFISPGEKEALRRLKAEPRARFIRLLPHALPPRYDPSAEDSREIAAGRLLILSPVAEVAAIPSLEMLRHQTAARQFRANCLLMNEIGAKLCESQLEKA